ncbi:DUF6573 family protein [Nocardia salmonicida]|uniref:DUF6573 family protein n=1 Tax=Nocardia salmonicida TaxID=53431 RepID=UPI0033D50A2C
MFEDAIVVDSYPRAEAIADGFLFDVTEPAAAQGFTCSVALGTQAWNDAVAYNGDTEAYPARINAVLVAAREAIRDWPVVAYRGEFAVERTDAGEVPDRVTLTAHFGPGDVGEVVATIMGPDDE